MSDRRQHPPCSPEQIVDWFARLKRGSDGVQVNFFDCMPDLEFSEAKYLCLVKNLNPDILVMQPTQD